MCRHFNDDVLKMRKIKIRSRTLNECARSIGANGKAEHDIRRDHIYFDIVLLVNRTNYYIQIAIPLAGAIGSMNHLVYLESQ